MVLEVTLSRELDLSRILGLSRFRKARLRVNLALEQGKGWTEINPGVVIFSSLDLRTMLTIFRDIYILVIIKD